MNKHAAVPCFCAECEKLMLDSLPEGRTELAGYCPHFSTLAQVTIEPTGRIRAWRLRGPLTEAESAIMIELGASMRAEIFAREKKSRPH